MVIVRNRKALGEAIRRLREEGKHIAFVPTMGALHTGHVSLITLGRKHADAVVASIFVNPTQFGPGEDYTRYPRTEEEDIAALRNAGASVAYLPAVEDMYPAGASTCVHVAGVSEGLCGAFRPGHFDGVATIVTKLFMQVQPDVAIFGEKDYQQLAVIRRLVSDLSIPVSIIGAPVMREANGLAMSSRNRYLSEAEQAIAPALYRQLKETARVLSLPECVVCMGGAIIEQAPHNNITHELGRMKAALLKAGFTRIDYVELCDAATLLPVTTLEAPARLLAAVHLGTTRLIDNIEVLP